MVPSKNRKKEKNTNIDLCLKLMVNLLMERLWWEELKKNLRCCWVSSWV